MTEIMELSAMETLMIDEINETALESNKVTEFIKNIVSTITKWWNEKAKPFLLRAVREFWAWIKRAAKSIRKMPKRFWDACTGFASKMKDKVNKIGDDVITADADETYSMPMSDFVSESFDGTMESFFEILTDASVMEVAGAKIDDSDFSNLHKVITGKYELDDSEAEVDVSEQDLNNFAKSVCGPVEDFVKKNANADKKVADAIEEEYEKTGDNNAASKKANNWMAKVSQFFKWIAGLFKSLADNIRAIANRKKKEKA